ncbi:MAG: o-succinylbenzoate--CoA ligase [bacterium]|nr:o-succinylbenzoate--CoA ligase [bacterium]
MHQPLLEQAQRTPHAIALYTPDTTLTYQQLADQIFANAKHLSALGIGAGDVVAILSHNTSTAVSMIFAISACGGVVLTLNTRLTGDELAYQLTLAEAKLLIIEDGLDVPPVAMPIIPIDVRAQHVAPLHTTHAPSDTIYRVPTPIQTDNSPAVIMFTSGTSGKPKGAMLTHDNLFANAIASHERLSMTQNDHWLCILPLYHIGGLSILIRCFMLGGCVSLLPKFDADAVHNVLCQRPITLISLVPTMLYRLLDMDTHLWQKSLRLILLGGATADAPLMRRCADLGLPVATTYGLTEASSQVCTATPDATQRKPASVGKPMPSITVRVVDEQGQNCLVGEIGEVAVRGKTVMAGYYKNPEASAKTIRDGELFTGDMGYLDADGDLWIIQRRSDLIVTGGENVYPAEIEAIVREIDGVRDVAVVGIPDAEWGQKVGCVLVADVAIVSIKEVEAFLRGKLAGYKVPRVWKFADALPLNATGKVNRDAVRGMLLSD